MNTWFECGVKYVKVDAEGREKKASEVYLIDAVSFTEAENRIYRVLEQMISGEFTVSKISKTNTIYFNVSTSTATTTKPRKPISIATYER